MIKRWMLGATAAVALVVAGGAAQAQQFFRIGTGGTAGTYYPVGGMIANAVSQPGKLVVTAQASNGSLANVTGIAGGAVESVSARPTWPAGPTPAKACSRASPPSAACA